MKGVKIYLCQKYTGKIEGLRKSKKDLEYRIQNLSNELNELKKRSVSETLNKEV